MADAPVALVTGASRGIGRAGALALAEAGWRVVALARAQKALEALDDEIRARGGNAPALVPFDLTDLDGIDQLAFTLHGRFGRLDGLFAAAGVLGDLTPMAQAAPAMVAHAMTLNALVAHRLIRACDPLLRQASPPGRALFVTSGAAHKGEAYWGPYAASKAALEAFVRAYAAEAAFQGVKANLLSPGPVRTAMRADAFPGEDPLTLPPPEALGPTICALLDPACTQTGAVIRFQPEGAGTA